MKQIYGIDLSKEKFDVDYLNLQKKSVHKVINNTFKDISKFLDKVPGNAIIVAEHTGVYGELLVFLANQRGIKICLETGYQIKHSLGLIKGKSDKIDAQRIREYGERYFDKLKETKYPCEEMQELNELYSLRKQLVKERKMLLCSNEKNNQSV